MRIINGDFQTKLFRAQSSDQSWLFVNGKENISYDIYVQISDLQKIKHLIIDTLEKDIESDEIFNNNIVAVIVDKDKLDEVLKIIGNSDCEIFNANYSLDNHNFNLDALNKKIAEANSKYDLRLDLEANMEVIDRILPSLDYPSELAELADIGIGLEVYHAIKENDKCYISIEQY